jgi:hypothetical protein
MIDGEVALTLVLMDTYITLMIWIGHLMRQPLTKLENIVLIIITIPRLASPLYLLLIVRPGGYTVNLCGFYLCVERIIDFVLFYFVFWRVKKRKERSGFTVLNYRSSILFKEFYDPCEF